MPIRIKPIADLQRKFVTNGSSASAQNEYASGIAQPRRSQAEAARAAATTWADATQEAITDGRFAANITAESEGKWKRNAAGKGKDRLAGGIRDAGDDWARETKPILDALAAVPDMPRGVKGSEANFARQRAYAMAAHDAARA